MDKKEFRKNQIAKIRAFGQTDTKRLEDEQLTKQFFKQIDLSNIKKVGITISMSHEVDTSKLIIMLQKMGIKTYLPKTNPDKSMDFYEYDEHTELKPSKFGVMEVAKPTNMNNDLDLIIVPGVAFSENGHQRVGFGGGHYDRFLAKYDIKTVALANTAMKYKDPIWSIESTDVPVDQIIFIN